MAIHEEMRKEEFKKIKELVFKISTIKKALIEERKNTSDFSSRIKEYENNIREKDLQIAAIKRESEQLEYQLNFEKTKKKSKKFTFNGVMDKIIHKEKYSKEKLDKLMEENQKLKTANRQMANKMEEEKELYLQDKIKFETELRLKGDTLSKIKEEIQVIQKENSKIQIVLQDINDKRQKYDIKKHKLEEEKSKKENELKELITTYSSIEQLSKDLDEDIIVKDTQIECLDKQLKDLAVKLSAAKEASLKKSLTKKVFGGKKIKKLAGGDIITFTLEQRDNKYYLRIREDDIEIKDVLKFELQNQNNRINIVYKNVSTYIYINIYNLFIQQAQKEKTLLVEVHESLTNKIITWYSEFLSEAGKAGEVM